ncbi:hypothetical protein FRB91_009303 [Serendipita sp. 411]|nr:hypothetical protein FRB91_009303 [Serendipita sp. 411]
MSSIRNSLHRRNHKERSQLVNRKRLGILEKHKDYVQRAKDFNEKKEKIKRLKQKVVDRNKDEFYFGMVNQRTKNGVHYRDRGNTSLPVDLVKILKSQDEGYLRTIRTKNLKRIEALKTEMLSLVSSVAEEGQLRWTEIETEYQKALQALDLAPTGKRKKNTSGHIIFVEDEDEAKQYSPPDVSSSKMQIDEEEEEYDLGWKRKPTENTSKREEQKPQQEGGPDKKKWNELLSELGDRLQRDTHLRYALRELEMQRILMGKGASKKIHGPQLVKSDQPDMDEMDEDERDAMMAKRIKEKPKRSAPEMSTYKPRVYKFRAERKK